MRVGGQRHAPAALPLWKTRYPLCRRLDGPRVGLDECENSRPPPPGFDPSTVQPVASRYTDWATRLWVRKYIFLAENRTTTPWLSSPSELLRHLVYAQGYFFFLLMNFFVFVLVFVYHCGWLPSQQCNSALIIVLWDRRFTTESYKIVPVSIAFVSSSSEFNDLRTT
jgi:hypothetical protein